MNEPHPITELLELADKFSGQIKDDNLGAEGDREMKWCADALRGVLSRCLRTTDGLSIGQVLWDAMGGACWDAQAPTLHKQYEERALAVLLAASGRRVPSVDELEAIHSKAITSGNVRRGTHTREARHETAREAIITVRDAILSKPAPTKQPFNIRHIPGFRALVEGEEWHTEFTEGMLPPGFRPLLMEEVEQDEDECFTGTLWENNGAFHSHNIAVCRANRSWMPHRTKRPLPELSPKPAMPPPENSGDFDFWWNKIGRHNTVTIYETARAAWIAATRAQHEWEKRYNEQTHTAALTAKERDEALEKLKASEARLAELEWRPVSVFPTAEDADSTGDVIWTDGPTIWNAPWDRAVGPTVTHWRPAALLRGISPRDKWLSAYSNHFPSREDAESAYEEARG